MKIKPLIFGTVAVISLTPLALAVGKVSAIVDADAGYLLGGSSSKQWRSAKQTAPSLQAPQKYRLYSLNRYLGEAIGKKPISQGAPCDETLFVDFPASKKTPALKTAAIGITGRWNALPRKVLQESAQSPVYIQAVSSELKKRGIAKPLVKITQVFRVDLDGDGTSEVLVSATRHAGNPGSPGSISADVQAGEYSIILLRKIVKGKLTTIPIAGEIYPKAKQFSAPNIFSVVAVLDVNGDGKMEIIVKSHYYEGDSTSVYSASGSKVEEVLSEGCGA